MINYNIQLLFKYSDEVWIDKTEYLQLPISIKKTLDDTLDIGEIVLNFTDDSEEYQAWTEVRLKVVANNTENEYYMVVQKDRVEEQNIGVNSYWKHSLTLIEATHKLSAVQLNDFSVTQPQKFAASVGNALENINTFIAENDNPENGAGPNRNSFTDTTQWESIGNITTGRITVFQLIANTYHELKLYNFKINRSQFQIKSSYFRDGSEIIFPELPTGTFNVAHLEWADLAYVFNWFLLFNYTNIAINNNKITLSDTLLETSFHARLIDVTSNTDVTNLIVNNRVNVNQLTDGHTYRYIVETGSAPGQPFWDSPANAEKLSKYYYNDGLSVKNWTIGNLVSSPTSMEVLAPIFFTPFEAVQNAAAIKPYSYYYDFTVSDELNVVPDGYRISDIIVKALDNTTTRRLQTSPLTLTQLTLASEYENAPGNLKYQLTMLTGQFASTIIGDLTKYTPGAKFKIDIYASSNPSIYVATVYYGITSDWETTPTAFAEDDDLSFQSTTYRAKKLPFSIDGDVLSYVANIPSPEFTFAGGKNLLEVLSEIGKSFNGIPRLKYVIGTANPLESAGENEEIFVADEGYEVITFDILSKLQDNPNFQHSDFRLNKQADSDNYATGLVSVVENALNDDLNAVNSVFYPSKNTWVKPKSKDQQESIFNLDKMAINIENENSGIYKIVSVKVRNFAASYASGGANYTAGLDITPQVVEKTVYNALEPTITARGTYLYYERGKSIIDGLSYLPQKDEIIGAAGTRYAIQLAINASGYTLSDTDRDTYPISDYQFQIEYIPVIRKARLFAEQMRSTGETKKIYSSFSQPERNISLTQFGENAETILRRTGVNSINAEYMITDPSQIPFIGEILQDSGKTYYADVVAVKYDNNSISAEVSYTRETNKLDKLVGYRRNYREYEILADDIVWKNKNINKYCRVTYGFSTGISGRTFSGTTVWRDSIKHPFQNNFPVSKLDMAVYQFTDLKGRRLGYTYDPPESPSATYTRADNIATNLTLGYTNNSMVFISSMYDNFQVGNTLEGIAYSAGNKFDIAQAISNFASANGINQIGLFRAIDNAIVVRDDNNDGFEDNRKRLKAVRYVDSFGRTPVARVRLGNSTSTYANLELPKIYSDQLMNTFSTSRMDETVLLDKDNREAIQMVFQLHFTTQDDRIHILSPFMKYNRLIANPIYDVDAGTTLEDYTGRLICVGIEDFKRALDEESVNFESSDILQSAPTTGNSGTLGDFTPFVGGSTFTPTKDYEGFGFVYENTGELALAIEIPLSQGVLFSRSIIHFNLSDEPI